MKRILTIAIWMVLTVLPALGQPGKSDLRKGNRAFRKGDFPAADLSYRRALQQDTASLPARYNLAGALYREKDMDGAWKQLEPMAESAAASPYAPQYLYNLGDVALQKQDWKAAMDAFRQCLLRTPDDLDAKENYIYARNKYLEQQQQQQQNQDQNQDQQNQQDQQDQNKDQNQDQQQDQQQDQNQDQQQDQQQSSAENQQLSAQQAAQMLQAIQAKEKETQDKVNKEKAAVLKSRQKEKNW